MSIRFADLACGLFKINGVQLELPHDSMRHLWPIYNRPDRAILLKFGRQTHKSTTLGFTISLPCIRYANYHSIYVSPTMMQTSVFSTDKLNNALRDSPVVEKYYMDKTTRDQIGYKELANRSKIYLRSAFHSAGSSRGISGDQTNIDEIQDILSDHIPIIEQCMSHSLPKWEHMHAADPFLPMHLFNHRMYAGTPKTVENTLERYWTRSTQNEWIIKCQHCGKYNYIDEKNIGPEFLICRFCEKDIHYTDGQWITMNHEGSLQGYRMPQIVLNWINNRKYPEVWKVNVIDTMNGGYTSQQFFNDVLALPYANAKNPILPEDIMAACQDYDMITRPQDGHPWLTGTYQIIAGIDWGKGDTAHGTSYSILCIGVLVSGIFKTVYLKRYTGRDSDPLLQIDDMLLKINQFKCNLVIADTGDGRTSNAMLVAKLGARRFAEIYEHGAMHQKIKWDKEQGIYVINRTRMMTDRVMEIKAKKCQFFKFEQFKPFKDDFLGIYSDYSEKTRMTRYDHTVPDDCFHAWMFARIGSLIVSNALDKYFGGGEVLD